MSLLLDTHALLWFLADNPKLPAETRDEIERASEPAFYSIASFWEIAIKTSMGKLAIAVPLADLKQVAAEQKLTLLAVDATHVVKVAALPFHHRDPFDRMLVAQALVEDLTIISADPALDAYGIRRLW